jgi:hypothetical protein
MFRCEQQARCQFFQELPKRLGLWIYFTTHYCEGAGYPQCARRVLLSKGENVPANLYPTQGWRIGEHRQSKSALAARRSGYTAPDS